MSFIQHVSQANDKPKGYEQITDLSSVQALTVPVGACHATFQAETQDIRFRDDGTDPTFAVGQLILAGSDPIHYYGDLSTVRFFEAVAGAALNVHYYADSGN